MGVDASRVEPPRRLPFLGWDAEALRRFVRFVKGSSDGTFKISRWKVMEFLGPDHLADIAELFAEFEEPGDTGVSGMHMATALILCNQVLHVRDKVAECLELFDWSGEGTMTFYDLLFLLQVAAKALSQVVPAVHADVRLDKLERVCREAVREKATKLQDLEEWAQRQHEVFVVLARLSPQDGEAVLMASMPSPRPPTTPARIQPGRRPASRGGVRPSSRAGAPEERAVGERLVFEESSRPSSRLRVATPVAREPDPDPVVRDEPPLASAASTLRDSMAFGLTQHLGASSHQIVRQLTVEEQREKAHAGAGRVLALERCWARACGAALPVAFRESAPPTDALFRAAFADLPWLHRGCLDEQGRFEALAVAAYFGGHAPAELAARRRAACGRAAEELAAWLHAREQACAQDAAHAAEAAAAELAVLEHRERDTARALELELARGAGGRQAMLHSLRRDLERVEGALAYLEALVARLGSPSVEASRRVAEAVELRAALQHQIHGLHEATQPAVDRHVAFLAAHVLRAAFADAAQQPGLAWPVLLQQLQEMRRGIPPGWEAMPRAIEGAGEEFGRIAAGLLEVAEARLHRCEGALVAAQTLVGGAELALQLRGFEADQLYRGTRRAEVAMYLGAPGLAHDGPLQRVRVLESLATALDHAVERLGHGAPFASQAAEVYAAAAHTLAPLASRETGGSGEGEPLVAAPGPGAEEAAEQLRRLRFAARRSAAAAEAAQALGGLLRGGLSAALLARLDAAAASAAAELRQFEAEAPWLEARGGEKRRAAVQAALQLCLAESGQLAHHAASLGDVAACVAAALRAVRGAAHGASPPAPAPLLAPGACGAVGQVFLLERRPVRRHAAAAAAAPSPMRPALSVEGVDGGEVEAPEAVEEEAEVDCQAGLATSGLHAQGAAALGALEALELASLATTHSAPADRHHCAAALRAEARLLASVAAHRLSMVEVEIRRAADPAGQWVLAAPPCRPTTPARPGTAASQGAPDPDSQALEAYFRAAERVLDACRVADVRAALEEWVTDPVLKAHAQVVSQLLEDCASNELTLAFGDGAGVTLHEPAPSPAPLVPHPSGWWRRGALDGPLFLGPGGQPCPRCAHLAELAWASLKSASSSAGVEPPQALPRPQALLLEHAAAFRVWALARARQAAAEALAQGAWGPALLAQSLRDAEELAGLAWRGELSRHHVGLLAASQQACLERASAFLRPLGPRDAEFLRLQDLDTHAHRLREELLEAMGEQAAGELEELRLALPARGAQARVLEGLLATLDALQSSPQGVPVALQRQAAECTRVVEALSAPQPKPPQRGAAAAQRITDCVGSMCAVERLRAFCLAGGAVPAPAAGDHPHAAGDHGTRANTPAAPVHHN